MPADPSSTQLALDLAGCFVFALSGGLAAVRARLDVFGVLVVGTAQSGCQIAEELYQAGRTVHLCAGSAGRAPRRYRGKDTVAWLDTIGFFDMTPDKLPFPKERFAAPHVRGARGGTRSTYTGSRATASRCWGTWPARRIIRCGSTRTCTRTWRGPTDSSARYRR